MADKPKVSLAMIKAMQDSVDSQLQRIWPDDPVEMIGVTQGAYISGSGAVFVSEVNLAPSAGISPFHPTITADELKRIHDKKISRLPKLKTAMQEWLLNSAGSLDPVPGRGTNRAGNHAVLLERRKYRGSAGSDRDARIEAGAVGYKNGTGR